MSIEPMAQAELLRDCRDQLARVDERARELTGSLTEDQLRWCPPDGGWSIGQVFAHLVASNGSYLPRLREAFAEQRSASNGSGERLWKPTFFGRMLIRSLDPRSQRRMPTPAGWRPAADRPSGTLEAFLACQREIADLTRTAETVDLVRTRVSSPVSRLIRLNAGDAFRVFVVHDWRHLGQIERVIARPGFPSA